ncbi:hypothetical protein C2E21_3840 [Chlorella sorokiniana]|jgi:hypothetical protein|uniref:Uncharacterized protein n=1 Tax=Chlorella sorokiniana TaxID=3076 RepID=A0A2P6TT07_CHLSO|nr:hypothetical protein C2E21_3840 [Chlorella sorokiniana]|eukprot:PRW57189.1 hypothetical protein C2E21_3840 [Chlorella sorokiniana]
MAALDCFLDLEPEPQAMAASPGATTAAAASPSAGSYATAVWAFDPKPKQQAVAHSEDDDLSQQHTASPGCSYSGSAALAAGLLELQDDACSAPTPLRQRWQAQQQQQQHAKQAAALLPDGTPLVATTFFDDLMQRGSMYQYCVRRG